MQTVDYSILFCCMGNICRSPTAEGVFRKLHQEYAPQLSMHIDSAGTHSYHVDQPPDERAIAAARGRGIDISAHRGRVATRDDFSCFDYILAMDNDNLSRLQRLRPTDGKAELRLLLEFAQDCEIQEVPDPYYGGATGFDQVLDLTRQGALGLLKHLCQRQGIKLQITNPSPFGRGVGERVR
ncbi:MAG: low molecular weight protein-tyrosine-phosphatase [Gammaproteobacteria bacterium]